LPRHLRWLARTAGGIASHMLVVTRARG